MEPEPPAAPGGAGQLPSSSSSSSSSSVPIPPPPQPPQQHPPPPLSRYESQKRRDWNTFLQYLHNHSPPLDLARCEEAHVVEFLKYQDQFGKTKVHAAGCALFGQPNPTAPCACPLRQAWGSLDALIGRLRAAYEESGGRQGANPFAARAVGIYLREVREEQARARGMPFKKKKKKRKRSPVGESSGGSAAAGAGSSSGPAGSTSSVTEAKHGGPPPYS